MVDVRENARWFWEHYEELSATYGHKFIVIKDCKVIGVYESRQEALYETSKIAKMGTFAVQECDMDEGSIPRFANVWGENV